MANHSKVSPPCIEWILSQIVAYSSFLHRCLHELNVLFRKNEVKNLMESSYESSMALAYFMIQKQQVKVKVLIYPEALAVLECRKLV